MKHYHSPNTPVGVYPPEDSQPEDFVSIDEARRLRKTGEYFAINNGRDIRRVGQIQRPIPEDKQKSAWRCLPSGLQSIGYVDVLQLV